MNDFEPRSHQEKKAPARKVRWPLTTHLKRGLLYCSIALATACTPIDRPIDNSTPSLRNIKERFTPTPVNSDVDETARTLRFQLPKNPDKAGVITFGENTAIVTSDHCLTKALSCVNTLVDKVRKNCVITSNTRQYTAKGLRQEIIFPDRRRTEQCFLALKESSR